MSWCGWKMWRWKWCIKNYSEEEWESCMKVKMTRQEWNELRVLNKLHFLFALWLAFFFRFMDDDQFSGTLSALMKVIRFNLAMKFFFILFFCLFMFSSIFGAIEWKSESHRSEGYNHVSNLFIKLDFRRVKFWLPLKMNHIPQYSSIQWVFLNNYIHVKLLQWWWGGKLMSDTPQKLTFQIELVFLAKFLSLPWRVRIVNYNWE